MNRPWLMLWVVMGLSVPVLRADWKVQFTGEAERMFGSAPRGSYATRQQCEVARQGLAPFEFRRSYCTGFDAPRGGGGFAYRPSASGGGSRGFAASMMAGLMQSFMQGFQQGLQAPPRDLAAERRRAEEDRRRREFEAWQKRLREEIARQDGEYRDLRRREIVQEARGLGDVLARRLGDQTPRVNPQADRLLQSACWSRRAALAAAQGDEAGAEVARANASKALEGSAPPCADQGLPSVPLPSSPVPPGTLEAELGRLVQEETTRVEAQIQGLVARQIQTKEAVTQRREALRTQEVAQASAENAATRAEADRLLAEARKALEEALAENLKASEELNAVQDTLQALKAVSTVAPGTVQKEATK